MKKTRLLLLLVLLMTAATGAWAQDPTTYKVTIKEGTEDATSWTVNPTTATTTGVAEGTEVTLQYNGRLKVKGVKAVSDEKPADNTYLKWDANQKKLVATEIPAEVKTAADANQDVLWEAGTYVVEGNVTISGQITLDGNVELIIKDGAKLTVTNQIASDDKNLSIYGQASQTGQLVVNCSDADAINNITTLEVHSAKVTASSSNNSCGGFYNIGTFNVYGGSVDAEGTSGEGYGIGLLDNGSMNIYGGEVRAEGNGNGNSYSYGIRSGFSGATVTVYGGTLWAGCADKAALRNTITLTKGDGFSGKIEYSSDNSTWSETADADAKYVRVGY